MRKAILTLIIGSILPILPGLATANPHSYPSGPNIGFGDSTALDRLQGNKENPAAPISDVRRGLRMGVVGFSIAYELGDVDNFGDRFDNFETQVQEFEDSLDNFGTNNDDDESVIVDLVESGKQAQQSVVDLTQGLYIGLGVKGNALPFPLEITSDALRGSLFLDVDFDVRSNISVLYGIPDDSPFSILSTDTNDYNVNGDCNDSSDFSGKPFCINSGGDVFSSPGEQVELDSTSLGEPSALVQGAFTRTISLGYGTTLSQNRAGTLFFGGRINHFAVELAQTAAGFEDEMMDTLQDGYKENRHSSTDVGLDAGLVWAGEWYRLGATAVNINGPTFAYSTIPESCGGEKSCELLNDAIERGDISRNRDYEMEPQLSFEGTIQTPGSSWLLSASADVNSVEGPFGKQFNDAYQWATLGAAYQPSAAWLPGARFSYRQNLAGSELSYVSGGLTLLGILSLDAAVATEMVDDTVPRGVMVSLGLETRF